MSLFSTILRPIARRDAAEARTTLPPWYSFDAAIQRSLQMLHGVHVPVSLFAVRFGESGRMDAATVAGEALSQFGPVGLLPDGSIGLLYLGPRAPDSAGDAVLTNRIFGRVERRLQERGWAALCRRLELVAVHGWTDEIGGSDDLVRALARRRMSPPYKH